MNNARFICPACKVVCQNWEFICCSIRCSTYISGVVMRTFQPVLIATLRSLYPDSTSVPQDLLPYSWTPFVKIEFFLETRVCPKAGGQGDCESPSTGSPPHFCDFFISSFIHDLDCHKHYLAGVLHRLLRSWQLKPALSRNCMNLHQFPHVVVLLDDISAFKLSATKFRKSFV